MYSRLTQQKLSNKSEFTLQGAHEYFLTYYIHKIFFKESWKVSGNIEKSWFVIYKMCGEAIVSGVCVCAWSRVSVVSPEAGPLVPL